MRIVGVDEIDLDRDHISWKSPLARALMKSRPGNVVALHAPGGAEQLQVLDMRFSESLSNRSRTTRRGGRAQPQPSAQDRVAATGDKSGVDGP